MKLALTCANTELWAKYLAFWQEICLYESIDTIIGSPSALLTAPQGLEQLAQLLQQPDITTLFVFFCQAEYSIAEQMLLNEQELTAAAENWQFIITELLAIQRLHRKKLKLVNLHQAIAYPEVLQQQLLAYGFPEAPQDQVTLPVSPELLLSCQYVRQQPELIQLNTRLQASALPLTASADVLLDLHHLQQTMTSRSAESANRQQESELLLHQLQHVQEELEQLFQKKLDVKQKYSSLKDEYEREVGQLNADLKSSAAKQQSVSKQLSSLQGELERITKEHNKVRSELANAKTAEQERDMLFSQLLQTQEVLELRQQQVTSEQAGYQAELDTLKSELARQTRQLQRELAKAEQQLKLREASLAKANYQQSRLSFELHEIKQSPLWKAVHPVHRLSLKRQTPAQREQQRDIALLMASDWFDSDWYLVRNPDVASSGMNPAEHYLKFGYQEGRMPSPRFDGSWYLQRYPDVAQSGINPLIHFIKFGLGEGRQASPMLLSNQTE